MTPTHLLIDLDGTLIDPAAGIVASFQRGLVAAGVDVLPAAQLDYVIGPPLRVSFPRAGVPADKVEIALNGYRQHYTAGAMLEAHVYDGIPAALATLKARGHALHVATSKPHVFARPILEHFALAHHFESIHGAELDGTRDAKADVIAHLLAEQSIDPRDALMIGDTPFDVIGARAHGISTIGVAWGHGGRKALADAGAAHIVDAPAALVEAVTQWTARA
jgi:phosphoglycolate phosphatase